MAALARWSFQQQPKNLPTPPNVMPLLPCPWKTSVSTPLHLPLSTRLGEISLSLGVPSKPFFGPFGAPGTGTPRGPLQPSHLARPNFLKGAPTGHGWRPPLSRRPPLGCPSRAAGASREAIATCAPPRSFYCTPGERVASQSHSTMPGKLDGLSSTKPPQPFPLRRKSWALDRPSGMQPRGGTGRTRFRCGENLST
jgi:hypothetical protein